MSASSHINVACEGLLKRHVPAPWLGTFLKLCVGLATDGGEVGVDNERIRSEYSRLVPLN